MNNKGMKKFIKLLKTIKLSQKEKAILRYKISEFVSFNPIRNDAHVPQKPLYFSIFTLKTLAKSVAFVLMVLIIVGGGGVSYASTNALPGDKLYNIKINVNEKIEEKLAFTTEAKIVVQTQKVERRLNEVQTLTKNNMLSPERKAVAKSTLVKDTQSMTKTIEALKDEGRSNDVLNATIKISPVLEAYKEILIERSADQNQEKDIVHKKEEDSEDEQNMLILLEAVDETIKTLEEIENNAVEKAIEDSSKIILIVDNSIEDAVKMLEALKKESLSFEKTENVHSSNQEEIIEERKVEILENTEINENVLQIEKTKEEEIVVSDEVEEKIEDLKITTDTSLSIENKEIRDSQTDLKIKDAENLIEKSIESRELHDYENALRFSQRAKHIMKQIEALKKIREEYQEIPLEESVSDKEKDLDTEVKETTDIEPTQEGDRKEILDRQNDNQKENVRVGVDNDLKAMSEVSNIIKVETPEINLGAETHLLR